MGFLKNKKTKEKKEENKMESIEIPQEEEVIGEEDLNKLDSLEDLELMEAKEQEKVIEEKAEIVEDKKEQIKLDSDQLTGLVSNHELRLQNLEAAFFRLKSI